MKMNGILKKLYKLSRSLPTCSLLGMARSLLPKAVRRCGPLVSLPGLPPYRNTIAEKLKANGELQASVSTKKRTVTGNSEQLGPEGTASLAAGLQQVPIANSGYAACRLLVTVQLLPFRVCLACF